MESQSKRERRRKRAEKKIDANLLNKIEKKIENVESEIETEIRQSSSEFFLRETYALPKSTSKENELVSEEIDDLKISSVEDSSFREISEGSKNLTYNVENEKDESKHDTYNILSSEGYKNHIPVPAPRKNKLVENLKEKVSSDTDRDVTDIDLDDAHSKSDKEQKSSFSERSIKLQSSQTTDGSVVAPVPKPRKIVVQAESENTLTPTTKIEIASQCEVFENPSQKTEDIQEEKIKLESDKVSSKQMSDHQQTGLTEEFQSEFALASKAEVENIMKRKKKLKITDLMEKKIKGKKSKMISSMIKMEKGKIPKISSIMKDLKEDKKKMTKNDEDDKADFHIDSPVYPESFQNGRIYVQSKNGFYAVQREEFLKSGNDVKLDKNGGIMEDSTVKTAILFQNYWSRSMLYFHGILAGFAFSHVATVTAIMKHINYSSFNFITIYSCLSLKIHYIFYTLMTLCIVSCCDRIDIGHMNRKHWQIACKVPSMWIALFIYVISLIMTFANHKMEANFGDSLYKNETEIQIWTSQKDTEARLVMWYHTIWARDLLLLLAWLIISLTRFSDFLLGHLKNMAKYAEAKNELHNFRQLADVKTETFTLEK